MSAAPGVDAQAFHDALPDGRGSGTLSALPDGVHFEGGGQRVSFPLDGLVLSLGGASNRLLFVSHPARPGWQVYTADLALLQAPALAGHPACAQVGGARRRHTRRMWAGLAAVLALLVALPFLLHWGLDGLATVIARRVPAEWERSLGDAALTQVRGQQTLMDARTAQALLQPLVAPLAPPAGTRHRYRFHIVNAPELNAFALPGGDIVVHSGLILKAGSAEELQGVLAHEMAHVMHQHGLRSVIRSLGVFVIAQAVIGDASGLLATVASAAPLLINQEYSRDFEREADREGLALLLAARINPQGFVSFFRTIRDEERRQIEKLGKPEAADAARTAMAYLGTHPDTDERIATLEARLRTLERQTWRDDRAAFAALQRQVQTFVTTTGTDNTDENRDTGQ